jgi:5'-nucleotidase/UDP-sugar diphosphatase
MSRFFRRLPALALLACALLRAEVRTLTILHTNDLHAHLSSAEDHRGGFAALVAAIRQQREGCHDCILLNAGDLVQGSPVSTIFHGLPVYEIGNLFGFDGATLGNHEFDYGWPQVRKFIQIANYPIISANLVNSEGRTFTPKPYVILKVNGLRVAVIGLMTDSLNELTTPRLVEPWHTLPAIETARRYAVELKPKSDLVVLLGHITDVEERRMLDSAPEFPVIVTGHSHGGLREALTRNNRVLVRVRAYGEELGRLELKVDTEKKAPVSWNWKRIPIGSPAVQPAQDVAALVKHWEGEVASRVNRPLGISKRPFTKVEVKRLIEQALREETGADFAWMNIGGVRAVLPQGPLLERKIWDIMPFDNRVLVGTFKGRDLPPRVAGDRKIDPSRDYTLAVSDYTAANQQTEENLGTTGLKFPNDVGLMRDILIDWFRKKKTIGDGVDR